MYLSLVCTYHWFFELLLSKDSGTLWFVICAFFERSSRYSLYSLVKTVITQLLVRCVHGMIKMTCQSLAPATLLRDSDTSVFLCFFRNFYNFFTEHLQENASDICTIIHLVGYTLSKRRDYCFDRLKKIYVRKIHLSNNIIITEGPFHDCSREKSHQSQNIVVNTFAIDESVDEENSTDELLMNY